MSVFNISHVRHTKFIPSLLPSLPLSLPRSLLTNIDRQQSDIVTLQNDSIFRAEAFYASAVRGGGGAGGTEGCGYEAPPVGPQKFGSLVRLGTSWELRYHGPVLRSPPPSSFWFSLRSFESPDNRLHLASVAFSPRCQP